MGEGTLKVSLVFDRRSAEEMDVISREMLERYQSRNGSAFFDGFRANGRR